MPPTPVRIVTNSGVYVCGGFEPIMIDIVVLQPAITGGNDGAHERPNLVLPEGQACTAVQEPIFIV